MCTYVPNFKFLAYSKRALDRDGGVNFTPSTRKTPPPQNEPLKSPPRLRDHLKVTILKFKAAVGGSGRRLVKSLTLFNYPLNKIDFHYCYRIWTPKTILTTVLEKSFFQE